MAHYDTGAMRKCAEDIQAELNANYQPAKESIDQIVSTMNGYFQDQVSTGFAQKYNSEAKTSAESVMRLMKQYISLLNQTADQYDNVINTGLRGING